MLTPNVRSYLFHVNALPPTTCKQLTVQQLSQSKRANGPKRKLWDHSTCAPTLPLIIGHGTDPWGQGHGSGPRDSEHPGRTRIADVWKGVMESWALAIVGLVGHLHMVLAQRADRKSDAARKKLVLADTVLFSEIKEPKQAVEDGNDVKNILRRFVQALIARTMPAAALQNILGMADLISSYHDEQCTLAEYCAHMARDVVSHSQLAAEARVKPRVRKQDAVSDSECEGDGEVQPKQADLTIFDVGGGGPDDIVDDTGDLRAGEISRYPLPWNQPQATIDVALQATAIDVSRAKSRRSHLDKQVLALHDAYGPMMEQGFSLQSDSAREAAGFHYPVEDFKHLMSMQKASIACAKVEQNGDQMDADSGATQPAAAGCAAQPAAGVVVVDLPLAQKGPVAVARKLIEDAQCTEEQITAVAGFVRDMQRRWEARSNKESHMFSREDLALAVGNHRVVWLGGGGVGKTRTLKLVVEPLTTTFFGTDGYCATAQSNHAAHNLGPRGRTIHSANGMLAHDSLQTAKLQLNAASQKKLDRIAGDLGVDVIDELGIVPAPLLHADALRKTYGRCLKYNLDSTLYMRPQETWGRVFAKILCGDFFQLPPVPATSSLMALPSTQESYEHRQGRKLLTDVEYVVDFVNMKRFDDPLQVQILEAMRTPGGKKISEAAWRSILQTEIRSGAGAGSSGASQPAAIDPRLRSARGWYESAYEWRIVTYAMHAQARLDAHDGNKILFYIPAIDVPSVLLTRDEHDEMRAEPNVQKTGKHLGILPIFEGMEMIPTESILPPQYARGSPCTVVGLQLHPLEPPIEGRDSLATHGCVVLQYMPKCIYVRFEDATDNHLPQTRPGASQPEAFDMKGVMAIEPKPRKWTYVSPKLKHGIDVMRTQIPLLPRKQCTLHGVQGKTAEPGFIVHWTYPQRLSAEAKWLAYYVSLSRPRSLKTMLSHGLPRRDIIEGGPPKDILDALANLFGDKIAATKVAFAEARAELGWPAKFPWNEGTLPSPQRSAPSLDAAQL